MADMLADGAVKVTYVPEIADISEPTTAELEAGTDLECLITADGLNITVNEDVVSIPKLCETSNSEAPGRATFQVTLTLVRQEDEADDVAWTTLERKTRGYLVIRYGIEHDVPYADGDSVLVFPGACGVQRPNATEANGAVTFDSQWYVARQPELHGVVVGGS